MDPAIAAGPMGPRTPIGGAGGHGRRPLRLAVVCLAADESPATIGKRFAAMTERTVRSTGRAYRTPAGHRPLASVRGVSGVILYEETLFQQACPPAPAKRAPRPRLFQGQPGPDRPASSWICRGALAGACPRKLGAPGL